MMNNRNTSSDEDDNGDLTNPGAGMNGSEIQGYKGHSPDSGTDSFS